MRLGHKHMGAMLLERVNEVIEKINKNEKKKEKMNDDSIKRNKTKKSRDPI